MNSFQGINSGKAELKDFYGQKDSVSEALRRRRRKMMEKREIPLEDESVDREKDKKDDF